MNKKIPIILFLFLDHPDYVVRTRVACILVDFGGEDKVQYIAKVLKMMKMNWLDMKQHLH